MIDLMSAAQDAVYRVLKAAEDAIGAPVLDDVPENTQPPFVRLGPIDSDFTGGKGEQVERLHVEVQVIYRGEDRSQMLAMMHQARVVLDRQPLAHNTVDFQPPRFVTAATSAPFNADGVTYVGIVQFIIDAEPADEAA